MNFENPTDADWDEFERKLANDDGAAAKEHLAAGFPIYYREDDTPEGACLKEYPEGHRELVTFSLEQGEVFVSEAPPRRRFGQLKGRLSVGDDFEDPLPDDLLDLFEGVEISTKKANDALDDALSFIQESNKRIDKM
jgi:hypothetical protein